MSTTHKPRACGNPKCGTSTGIHEGLTFGWGRLDEYGFWQRPCSTCAREWDKRRAQVKAELIAKGSDPANLEWCDIEGWPFAKNIESEK